MELPLDRAGDARPLFVQIAEGLAAGIRAGRLPSGSRLPGSRALAARLGVHRNTVLSAYAELVSEGWLDGRGGSGTYVSDDLPQPPQGLALPDVSRDPHRIGVALPPPPSQTRPLPPSGMLSFGSTPDTRSVPWPALARAYRRVLARAAPALLDYADPAGDLALRTALAEMLAQLRGLAIGAEDVFITRGSQMALYLVARSLCVPGDCVAVEGLGYRPAWAAFEAAGAELVPIPVDAQGLDVAAFEVLVARRRVRAVYLTPHHQYPTTVSLSPARRLHLLQLAAAHGVAVIEDDYDNEFHYEARPLLPLAAADRAGVVLYVGTLSKVLAPGLRLGFLVAPRPMLSRVAAWRLHIDRQGDAALERALADLFEDGEVQRHVRRMRGVYRQRRDHLVSALRANLGGSLTFEVPRGGLAIWSQVDPGLDVEAWTQRAAQRGVYLMPGRQFTFDDQPMQGLRLGFAQLEPSELAEAVRRLAEAR
jgi:GntR family transcriptional regulator/MocR family aminotransferase